MHRNSEDTYQVVGKTHQGFEQLLADELQELGIGPVKLGRRAVFFETNLSGIYKANLHCATALRFLVEIAFYSAKDDDTLYQKAKQVSWERFLHLEQTFAVDATVFSAVFSHSHFASLRIKDAIVDHFQQKHGLRPSVNTKNPDVVVHLHIAEDNITLLVDSSGGSLHKRGYRIQSVPAPLNEVLAAGLVRLSGWNKKTPFYDAMCGSGTFAIEAAFYASNAPVNSLRPHFGFQEWDNYNHKLWLEMVNKAKRSQLKITAPIFASDMDRRAVRATQNNVTAAQLLDHINIEHQDFFELQPSEDQGMVVLNPPYGERLKPIEINDQYAQIGSQLKKHFTGFNAAILSANVDALKCIGLKPKSKLTFFNGPLQTKFFVYDLYKGSRKTRDKTK